MNIWKRLVALFRRKANTDDPEPQSKRYVLDEQARVEARIADARLPPYWGSRKGEGPKLPIGAPYGIRTRVSALRGPRPGPLDEGSEAGRRLIVEGPRWRNPSHAADNLR